MIKLNALLMASLNQTSGPEPTQLTFTAGTFSILVGFLDGYCGSKLDNGNLVPPASFYAMADVGSTSQFVIAGVDATTDLAGRTLTVNGVTVAFDDAVEPSGYDPSGGTTYYWPDLFGFEDGETYTLVIS